MDNADTNSSRVDSKILLIFLWIMSLAFVGFVSFIYGKSSNAPNSLSQKPTPTNAITGITTVPTETPSPTTSVIAPTQPVDLETACALTGAAQKKEYLKPYILKEGDTINSVAEKELGDTTRNTEILTLNDNIQQLTIGSILYLPPDFIKQSSGHIGQVSGKIIKKDNASWQLTYGGGEKGPGIWMPGYWFKDVPNLDSYKIGDCVTILFDNSVKVYTVKKQ